MFGTWTPSLDTDINIFIFVDGDEMKNLVLVDKYTSQICSSEEFYMRRIMNRYEVAITKKGVSSRDVYWNLQDWEPDFSRRKFTSGTDTSNHRFVFLRACEHGYTSLVRDYLEKQKIAIYSNVSYPGMLAENILSVDSFSTTIDTNQWDVIDILLDHGLILDSISWELKLILSDSNNREGYERWIKKGLKLKDPYASCLRCATAKGYNELSLFLIERGASVNMSFMFPDYSPFVYAVKYCSLDVIKKLVDKGADIHAYNDIVFRDEIWEESSMLKKTEPRLDVVEYLKTLIA